MITSFFIDVSIYISMVRAKQQWRVSAVEVAHRCGCWSLLASYGYRSDGDEGAGVLVWSTLPGKMNKGPHVRTYISTVTRP